MGIDRKIALPTGKAESCDPALYGAVTFYSCACYKTFEQIGHENAQQAANAAGEASLRYPLWKRDEKGVFPEFVIPHFGKKSSVFCIALQAAFLVWTCLKAGMSLPKSVLLRAALDGHRLWKLGVG